jgi:hypothetical protein
MEDPSIVKVVEFVLPILNKDSYNPYFSLEISQGLCCRKFSFIGFYCQQSSVCSTIKINLYKGTPY